MLIPGSWTLLLHFRPISTANYLSSFTQNKALFPNTCLETFRYFISSHSFSSVAFRGVLCYFNTLKAYLRYFTVAHYSSIHVFLFLLSPFVPPSSLPSLSFTGTLLSNIFQQGVLPPRSAGMGPETRDGARSAAVSPASRDGELDLQNNQGWRDNAKHPGMER